MKNKSGAEGPNGTLVLNRGEQTYVDVTINPNTLRWLAQRGKPATMRILTYNIKAAKGCRPSSVDLGFEDKDFVFEIQRR